MRLRASSLLACLCISITAHDALAWGERGHNAIARVAARLIAANKDPDVAAFGAMLRRREYMLGHLANVPDIVWRSAGPEIEADNAPSHFVDIDYILPEGAAPQAQDLPSDFAAYKKALISNCGRKQLSCAPGNSEDDKLSKAGHAPFRVQNLTDELQRVFTELKKLEADPKASTEARNALIDKSLLYSGILAHFVGDLANPHHTSKDYDGWQIDQGGLHSYFESELVDAQDLDLEPAVLSRAQKDHPAARLAVKGHPQAITLAWALTLDSHARLDTLSELDRKQSLLKKSDQAHHIRAQRRAAIDTAPQYREFIVERLAIGAETLATIWTGAWEAAGRPRVDAYQSFNYPVKPEFLPLVYYSKSRSLPAPQK